MTVSEGEINHKNLKKNFFVNGMKTDCQISEENVWEKINYWYYFLSRVDETIFI